MYVEGTVFLHALSRRNLRVTCVQLCNQTSTIVWHHKMTYQRAGQSLLRYRPPGWAGKRHPPPQPRHPHQVWRWSPSLPCPRSGYVNYLFFKIRLSSCASAYNSRKKIRQGRTKRIQNAFELMMHRVATSKHNLLYSLRTLSQNGNIQTQPFILITDTVSKWQHPNTTVYTDHGHCLKMETSKHNL